MNDEQLRTSIFYCLTQERLHESVDEEELDGFLELIEDTIKTEALILLFTK